MGSVYFLCILVLFGKSSNLLWNNTKGLSSMKIISNYRDFYDYVLAIRGIDEKAVFVRNCSYKPPHLSFPNTPRYEHYMIAFCGFLYSIHYYSGKFYFGDDYKEIPKNELTKVLWYYSFNTQSASKFHLSKTNINNIENCPVILVRMDRNNYGEFEVCHKSARLKDYGFPSIMSADDCFVQITNFLLREKEVTDPRTNKEKIIVHGFDFITSFRKM